MGFFALLILIVPENSLPDKKDIPWVLLSLICALCYALENIYIDKLKLIIENKNYYFSNVIARSSKTMLDCHNSKIEVKKTGTEG